MIHSPTTRVPVGFRFHPTDEELVGYYLPKKVAAKQIDLDLIKELDLYKLEPWDLQGMQQDATLIVRSEDAAGMWCSRVIRPKGFVTI